MRVFYCLVVCLFVLSKEKHGDKKWTSAAAFIDLATDHFEEQRVFWFPSYIR